MLKNIGIDQTKLKELRRALHYTLKRNNIYSFLIINHYYMINIDFLVSLHLGK